MTTTEETEGDEVEEEAEVVTTIKGVITTQVAEIVRTQEAISHWELSNSQQLRLISRLRKAFWSEPRLMSLRRSYKIKARRQDSKLRRRETLTRPSEKPSTKWHLIPLKSYSVRSE